MRRPALFLCMIILLNHNSIAQPSVPVDLLTGRAQVSVPLGAVTYGKLSIPVSLYYNASGVKPQSVEGGAGMNWDIIAGGKITREVRGLPDDYNGNSLDASDTRKGWLLNYAQQINDFVFTGDDNLTVCSDEYNDWTFIHDLAYTRDPEPDVFTFSAPGLSGQFVFGPDKLPKLIPYQDLKIEFTPSALNGPITQIAITKNDGTRYFFSVTETITRKAGFNYAGPVITQFTTQFEHFRKSTKFTSVWSLSAISTPSGEGIGFCYGNSCIDDQIYDWNEPISNSKKDVDIVSTSSTATTAPYKQYYVIDIVESKLLVAIQSMPKFVRIKWAYEGVINEVVFSDRLTGASKVFKLLYQEAKNPSETSGKKFLKQINEENGNCESFPAFQFEYYDITYGAYAATTSLPLNSPNVKQDLWGYFNDWAVSKNPTLYYYNTKTGAERYRFYPIPGLTAAATINGANRAINSAKVMYGSLRKIIYPTGGSATIVYEPNEYHDVEANTTQYGPGIRVSQVTLEDNVITGSQNTVIDYQYKAADNTSSGKWIYRSSFGYHDVGNFYAIREDQSPEPLIMYERVTVSQAGKGKTVYEYHLPGMYPATSVSDWNASRTKIARYSGTCAALGELKNQYFIHPFAPNTNYDFERGLPWKIADYNESGDKIHEKEYTYQRLGTPAVMVKGLRYELLNGTSNLTMGAGASSNLYVFSHYSLMANIGKVVLTKTERTADMNDVTRLFETTSTYTYSSVHRMLSHIAQLNSDGNTYKTRFKYAKDFSGLVNPDPSDVNSVMIKKLNDEFRHGIPVETINSVIKSGAETTTGANLILFGNFPDSVGTTSRALPVETRTFAGTTGFAEAVVSPASGTNQVISFSNTVYKPAGYIDNYDFIGNAVAVRSIQKNKKSLHLGYKKTLPVADINNAAASEVVFAGFETYTGGEFNIVPPGLSYPAGWTGKRAIQMLSGTTLEKTSVTKGTGNYYRYSCWLNASSAVQLNFRIYNGSTLVNTGTVSYTASDLNQWKYFEGRIDVSAAGSPFKLTVDATGTVTADDIAFYPETASISTFTYEPLFGKTSETDTRGISAFFEYDNLGRLKYVKDQDKNLLQSYDYYYKVQPAQVVKSSFNASHAPHQVVKNVTASYTANTYLNCGIAPLEYDWYVNDVLLGDNVTTFQYTYSLEQVYVLKLVVRHPALGEAATSITYDVKNIGTGPITTTVADASGTNAYAFCDIVHTKTFNATLSGCYVLQDVDVNWFYNINGTWMPVLSETYSAVLSNDRLTLTFDPVIAFNGVNNMAAYSVKCEVSTTCPVTAVYSTKSFTLSISYDGNQICP